MLIVLDSNEFIFSFGPKPKPQCKILLEEIVLQPETFRLKIPRTIAEEVRRNMNPRGYKDFLLLIETLGVSIDEDWCVPYELGFKYESLGLKHGDAFIAAYTEWTGAQSLVTENRDFKGIPSLPLLPFRVLRAEEFLKEIVLD